MHACHFVTVKFKFQFHTEHDQIPVNSYSRNGLNTMDKLFDYVCNRYGMREALGTRIVIRETEEKQSNGKVFRKYELGGFKWRTFYDFTTEAKTVAGGMRQLGLRAGELF